MTKTKKKKLTLDQNIIIERDYTKGTSTRFFEDFPKELKLRGVDKKVFKETIAKINMHFEEAEEVNCHSFFEGLLGCLSFYSIYMCYQPHSYQVLKSMKRMIDEENEKYYRPRGLEIINPISNGLVLLEIKVYPLEETQNNNKIIKEKEK